MVVFFVLRTLCGRDLYVLNTAILFILFLKLSILGLQLLILGFVCYLLWRLWNSNRGLLSFWWFLLLVGKLDSIQKALRSCVGNYSSRAWWPYTLWCCFDWHFGLLFLILWFPLIVLTLFLLLLLVLLQVGMSILGFGSYREFLNEDGCSAVQHPQILKVGLSIFINFCFIILF